LSWIASTVLVVARASSAPPARARRLGVACFAARLMAGLALSVAAFGCHDAGPSARPRSLNEFTLATFNVYFPAADDPETVAAVGATGADVVLLQEISLRWRDVLERRYAEVYPYRAFFPAGGAGGLGVLSRFPIRNGGLLKAPIKHPAWLLGVTTPAGDLTVLNVHLRASRRPGQNLIAGLLSMSNDHEREIRELLGGAGVEPDIVAGDFNEGPQGGAVTWLVARGFVDALERHHPNEPTFRTLAGMYSSTLDHVLCGARLSVIDAWVLRRGNSDHWPLVVRVRRAAASAR
jgi:endonuclease/exonuclease/phosphatase (EEP) superfamily protein YafD